MKKALVILAALTAALLLLVGCSSSKSITVELPANATTGYTWMVEMDKEGVLEMTGDEYIAPNSDLVGAGGTQKYTFAAVGDGTVSITFTYLQSWDPDSAANTSVRTYEVANGEITEKSVSEDLSGISG